MIRSWELKLVKLIYKEVYSSKKRELIEVQRDGKRSLENSAKENVFLR